MSRELFFASPCAPVLAASRDIDAGHHQSPSIGG